MAKTVSPGTITLPNGAGFTANAVPDPFDERDLLYLPRLEPLPARLDQRHPGLKGFVLMQEGNSCTGHAVAALVNTVLAAGSAAGPSADGGGRRAARPRRVSPYMLYRLGRRYDEWEGEEDLGSSLRGVFKGWFHHGVALEEDWPALRMEPEPDLDDPAFVERCRDRPLGAFYRVNPYRLDDMQSAIRELNAVAVSAVIHEGWREPVVLRHGREEMHVIARPVGAHALGGHAFALVGYNATGFLVQNSWGPDWGKGGYATLPYEDWLDSAYDAWVARPGAPRTPFASGRSATARGTGGRLVTAPAPDLRRLQAHVVNLGNEGRLSTCGKFVSTPAQIERLFQHMARWHDLWQETAPGSPRRILLYAHGGLVSEAGGLETAQRQLNWWLNNRVYPVTFAWQSGPAETLINSLVDVMKERLPFGGLGFDLVEQFDRLVELSARRSLRWLWEEMKENARAASAPIADPSALQWPPLDSAALDAMAAMPGASLFVSRLARYVAEHGADAVEVHLAGHSAGSIFHAALLGRLAAAGVDVASLALLAPALRVDEFEREVLPRLGAGGTVRRFATFALSDALERDDVCGAGGIEIYHKSLLYLLSRALERAPGERCETPLLGMERFWDEPLPTGGGITLREAVAASGGATVVAPAAAPPDARSGATAHGAFDDDPPTMTSVLLRVLAVATPEPRHAYQPHAPLLDGGSAMEGGQAAPPDSFPAAATTRPPGETPLVESAAAQGARPAAPPQPRALPLEVGVAPRSGRAIVDVLAAAGWRVAGADGRRAGRGGAGGERAAGKGRTAGSARLNARRGRRQDRPG